MAGEDAAALRARLEELLPLIMTQEKALERHEKEHEALLDAIAATEATRDSLSEALQTPACVAQAAANQALEEVSKLDRKPIDEVRALAAPPKPVVRTLALVQGILFGRDGNSASPAAAATSRAAAAAPTSPTRGSSASRSSRVSPPPRAVAERASGLTSPSRNSASRGGAPGDSAVLWRELQKMLRQDNFLARLRGFRVDSSRLMDEALCAGLVASFIEGGKPGEEPLTEEVVVRASQAVAVLFKWAQAQLELAPLTRERMAIKECQGQNTTLARHLDAAEQARARLAIAAMQGSFQAAMQRSALCSPVSLVDAIHSSDNGTAAVRALQEQLRSAEALAAHLQEQHSAKAQEVESARHELGAVKTETVQLELEIEAASNVKSGAPFCECSEEMVYRECCNLADLNWGRKFWKCPRMRGGCGKRVWDDSAPVTDISAARVGG